MDVGRILKNHISCINKKFFFLFYRKSKNDKYLQSGFSHAVGKKNLTEEGGGKGAGRQLAPPQTLLSVHAHARTIKQAEKAA